MLHVFYLYNCKKGNDVSYVRPADFNGKQQEKYAVSQTSLL